ncbi:MAG: hypothetical protein HGA75_17895 [Thiobacillus sp.]|nr:hypothetical protein [Thiobacillus sp.]
MFVSTAVFSLFREVTPLVEPLSLDEAYLDVTENKPQIPSATEIARQIRCMIREETQLTASAGVAPNKFLAKLASDLEKPDGFVVIETDEAPARLAFMPELVDEREDYANAIALNSTFVNLAMVIGPAVAGLVYAWKGPAWCENLLK